MKSAWLITWEWAGNHAAMDKKVVSLINYRKTGEYIRNFVEQLYIVHNSTDGEKASYAKNSHSNPYPAYFAKIGGVSWHGRIYCGHNPHLYARLVSNIRTEEVDGGEVLRWDERAIPSFPD